MSLDRHNETFLEAARMKPAKPLADTSVEELRAAVDALIPLGFAREEVAEVSDRDVEGTPVRVYVPAEDAPAAVLWLHGGSFVRCGLPTHDSMFRRFANRSGCTVVAVDYKLAPESQYPTQNIEVRKAIDWWRGRDEAPVQLYLAGESSGGTLAAGLTLQLRDAQATTPDGLLLILPVLDRDSCTASRRELAADYMLTDEQLQWMFDQWAPGAASNDPYVYPFRADSLVGLPPTIVITAEYDPLRDEGEQFARRIRDEGGSAQCVRIPGITHHAPLVPKAIPAGAAVIDRAAEMVRHATLTTHNCS
jgi:acetyl esterase